MQFSVNMQLNGRHLRIDSLFLHVESLDLNVALDRWGFFFFVLCYCTHSPAATLSLNLSVLTDAGFVFVFHLY